MSSVWKRIQRVGKRASKFQFIASYQALTLECSRDGKWQPNKLSVVWTRRNRRKAVKPETWQPSIANPFRGMIVWTDPEEVEISVTLYKDAREGSPFEDKLWTFVIEDESVTGKRRPVASVAVNMVDYQSVDLKTFCLNLRLRPASKKVISASLELNLACVLLKEGNATDEDMISMSSLLSLNDPYGSPFDCDPSAGKNFKRNAGKRLSLRSAKSKNKPTFNLASNTGSPKEPKKNLKNKTKPPKNDSLNMSLPANHITANGLNKPMSTSDPDLSKVENSSRSIEPGRKEEQMSAAEESLLQWCQECVKGYTNVHVTNMTTSWRNGLAFCAIVNHFNPELIDFSILKPDDIRENNRLAFEAFDYLGISRMLDPHQMVFSSVPDKLLIMTYLHQIKQYFTTPKTAAVADGQADNISLATIVEAERNLRLNTETLINDIDNNDFTKLMNYNERTDTSKDDVGNVKYEANPGYNPFEEDDSVAKNDLEIGMVPASLEDVELQEETTKEKNSKPVVQGRQTAPKEPIKPSQEETDITKETNSKSVIQGRQTAPVEPMKLSQRETEITKGRQTAPEKPIKFPQEETDIKKEKNSKPVVQRKQTAPEEPIKSSQKETEITAEDPWKLGTNEGDTNKLRAKNKELDDITTKPEILHTTDNKPLQESAVLYSPKPGYNPFLDEETEGLNSTTKDREKPKSLNPFDEDFVEEELSETETVKESKCKSLNPFDENYEEPFETDVDTVVCDATDTVKSTGTSDADNALGSSADKRLEETNIDAVLHEKNSEKSPRTTSSRLQTETDTSADKRLEETNIDEVLHEKNSERSPRTTSSRLQTETDISGDKNTTSESQVDKQHNHVRNNTRTVSTVSSSRTALAKTSESKIPVLKMTENTQVSQMHRKETRRPVGTAKPTIKKQLTESHIKLKRPESADLGKKGTPTSPTPARGQLSLPTSPRGRIPSFEEWKAKKSDEAAKQERLKAQARQMIKEARARSARPPNTSGIEQDSKEKVVSSSSPVPASASLPRLQSSKKYKAPEPPSAGRQGSLASKLKDEIEYQKKITEKTRKTLESSRIKRINPKQESVPEVQPRSERSEKVQQAIREAMEKPNKKNANPESVTNSPAEDAATMEAPGVPTPPSKPPRVYTYTKEGVQPEGTGDESKTEEKNETQGTQEKVEEGNEPANSSLQQNPFKLTLKKKEATPQAVIKPLATTVGRETKIDLKKYSVKSRQPSEPLAESRTHSASGVSGQLSSSQESLSNGELTSEEDVNEILDNIGDVSESENKTDDELYDNAEDEEGFQDTSQYVDHEIAVLEEDRIALDLVAVKLEKELRDAMNTADCKEEEQRLFQEWFLLVNKRNEIVRRQTELSILEKEEDLEKRFELLNRELRFLMADNNREKTAHEKKREELLLAELLHLVDKRDELVRIEDSQVQQAEKVAQHVEHVVRNTKIPKKQAECSIQ